MQFSFDATTVAPETGEGGGFIPVSNDPRGTLVVITDAGDGNGNLMVANKGNNGAFMPLKIKVIEGPDNGKEAVWRLNLQHEKHNVVMRGYAELSAVCYVTGVMRIQNTIAEIFNKPFRLVSELQDKDKPDGYTQLANGGIRDVNGNKAGKAGQGPQSTAPQPQQGQPQQWGGAPGQPGGAPAQGAPAQGGWGGPPQGQQPQPGPQVETGPAQGTPAWGGPPQNGPAPQGQPQQGAPSWGAPQGQPANNGAPAWGGAPQGGAPSWAGPSQ